MNDTSKCVWDCVIQALPCLFWGIIVLVAIYLALKFVVKPSLDNWWKNKLANAAFKREKEREKAKKDDSCIKEGGQELKELILQLEEKEKAFDLTKKLLALYEETFNKLNVEFKTKDTKPNNK